MDYSTRTTTTVPLFAGRTGASGNPVISGVVRTQTGSPIQGAIVIGSDLNYAETDTNGYFELKNPDDTLVCWCTGFAPATQVVRPGAGAGLMEIFLRTL